MGAADQGIREVVGLAVGELWLWPIKMDGCIIAPRSGCLPATKTIRTTTLIIITTSMTTNSCMHATDPVDNE